MYQVHIQDGVKFLTKMGGAAQGAYGSLLECDCGIDDLEGVSGDECLIVVSRYLKEALSPLEFTAIVLHEEGHFAGEHSQRAEACAQSTVMLGAGRLLTDPVYELEADAYCARVMGSGEFMVRVLERLPEIVYGPSILVEILMTHKKVGQTEAVSMINGAKVALVAALQYRIDALRAL